MEEVVNWRKDIVSSLHVLPLIGQADRGPKSKGAEASQAVDDEVCQTDTWSMNH